MSENQLQGLGALQNFENLDLSTTDTSYPVLKSGIAEWQITRAVVEPSKDKKTEMIVLECVTTTNLTDKHDKPVPAGYKITHRIGLTPTFKDDGSPARTPENIMRDVASLLDAVYGEAGRKRIKLATFDMAGLVNQKFMARNSIDPEKDGYPEQTRLSRFIRKEGNLPEIPSGAIAQPTPNL